MVKQDAQWLLEAGDARDRHLAGENLRNFFQNIVGLALAMTGGAMVKARRKTE